MRHPSPGRLRQQVASLRQEFLQEGQLPFADVLSPGCLSEAMKQIKAPWKDLLFTRRHVSETARATEVGCVRALTMTSLRIGPQAPPHHLLALRSSVQADRPG